MLSNYLKIAYRNLARHKGYAFINVAGLAVGLAACLVIGLYVIHELSYDRFHTNAERIYRVVTEGRLSSKGVGSATTPRPLARALTANLPEVEAVTRMSTEGADQVLVRSEEERFFEDRVLFADSSVFAVFTIPLIRGDPATALANPFSVVLTEATARKYFGQNDPIGKTLSLRLSGDRTAFDYRVTGIAGAASPSHFRFDFLASYQKHPLVGEDEDQNNWEASTLYTYVLLREGTRAEALEAKLSELVSRHRESQGSEALSVQNAGVESSARLILQPLTDIHLHSHLRNELAPNGDVVYVYLFSVIAIFVLLIACVNFINLAVARSAERAKEVGVRKVVGGHRGQLIWQFLVECTVVSFLALALAMGLAKMLVPVFNGLVGTSLSTQGLMDVQVMPGLIGLGLLLGLVSGAYPAFYLSAFRPVAALKGKVATGSRSWLRGGLVVFQFSVAIALITCTSVIYTQMGYVRTKDLGFGEAHVVVIEGGEVLGPQIETFKKTVQAHTGIVSVANGQAVPGRSFGQTQVRIGGAASLDQVALPWMTVSYGFIETLGIALESGRSFSPAFATDSMAVILNEAAVRELGLIEPVGRTLIENDRSYEIIGVVKDFHFTSLHQEVNPFVLFGPDPWSQNRPNQLVVARLRTDDLQNTLSFLKTTWAEFAPQQPFVYSFLDEDFNALYQADRMTGKLFGISALLAIFIACLGLFGLVAFTAEQRTKEVGIRKVLGASIASIVALLSKDFLKLVLIAFIVAAPLAYLAMQRWLEGFAYRIEIGPGAFLLAGGLALLVALLTVSYQAIKTALADPVESLRDE